MFCPKCHTQILDDSIKFCSRCGESLEKKKRKNTFSNNSSFSSISASSTFKYMSKYGKKTNNDFNYDNQKNEEALERALNNDQVECNINQPINTNNHNDQFNYSVNYSGVTKRNQSHNQQFDYSKKYSNVTKKSKTHDEQYEYSQNYSNATQQQVTSDDSYKLAFIGKNKESIIKSKISVPALIFGPLYLIYRKMYTLGVTLVLILFVLLIYFGENISSFQIFINVILALKFKIIYLNYVNKKVEEIKNNSQNKTTTEILYECSQKGNTLTFKSIIKYTIAFYILSIICSAIYEVKQKSIELPINDNQNTTIGAYEIGNYKFYTPYILNQTVKTSTSNVYEHHPNEDINKNCIFQVNRTYTKNNIETYLMIEQQKYPNYKISNIYKETKTNEITWYYQYLYPQISNDYIKINAMKDHYSNEIYSITTMSYNTNECEEITNNIINNFKKKN